MQLFIKILKCKRGSVGIGTALAGVAAAGVGAAASKGIGSLLGTGGQAANLTNTIDPTTLAANQTATTGGVNAATQYAGQLQGAGAQGVGAQQQLLQALQMQAAGQGPNPAQAALANNTQANVAQTAALQAGTRGASANAGALARQVGMQGGALQQQAVGQQSELQANQQLAAQQQLGAQANQQVAQQGQAIGQQNQVAQGAQGLGLNAAAHQNNAAVGSQASVNTSNMPITNQLIGGIQAAGTGALASAAPQVPVKPKMAKGGEVPGKALTPGDSEDNDVVPTLLSPGEIVIPRSFASDPKAAAAFAHACALFANQGK